jgi:heme exporter protein C
MKIAKLLLLPFYAAVIAAAFLWPEPAKGFIGESSRIVFFHVPCAIVAAIAFLVAGAYSLLFLRSGNAQFDDLASSAVRLGLLFAVLTIVTGSVFSRIMWGAYWNWDPRQSSYLLLIFVYGAYLFLRAAIEDPEKRTRLAAAYALFAIVPMVFLVFVAPRITQSLHPQTIINPQGKVLMDTPTRVVFFSGLIANCALFAWLLSLEARAARLERTRG